MTPTEAIEVGREAVVTMLIVSLPLMLISLGVGLLISLFQALTQLQEQTLTFVPKLVIIFSALIFLAPFMLRHLTTFFEGIADKIIGLGT